jgi:hypothetical protein
MIQKKLESFTKGGKRYEEIYVKDIENVSLHNTVTFIVVTTLSNFDVFNIYFIISLSSLGKSL